MSVENVIRASPVQACTSSSRGAQSKSTSARRARTVVAGLPHGGTPDQVQRPAHRRLLDHRWERRHRDDLLQAGAPVARVATEAVAPEARLPAGLILEVVEPINSGHGRRTPVYAVRNSRTSPWKRSGCSTGTAWP